MRGGRRLELFLVTAFLVVCAAVGNFAESQHRLVAGPVEDDRFHGSNLLP